MEQLSSKYASTTLLQKDSPPEMIPPDPAATSNTIQEINLSEINKKEDVPTPLRQDIVSRLRYIEDLKFFLVTAPIKWMDGQIIRKYYLNEELGYISCIYWVNLYYITGTDIIKILIFRFEKFGRRILNRKKFEEGIFSDLRNLKVDEHCILQSPRSSMLQFLHKNNCIKTQKKQKVFFWFSVLHDRLFADCLERDLKRELEIQKLHQSAKATGQPVNQDKLNLLTRSLTTKASNEPSLSFKYDPHKGLKPKNESLNETKESVNASKNKLYEQLVDYMQTLDMVKTPLATDLKFNLDSATNINRIDETSVDNSENIVKAANFNSPAFMKQESPKLEARKNDNFISNTRVDKVKSISKNKSKRHPNLSINVPDNNNIKARKSSSFVSNYDSFNKNITNDGDFPLDYFPVEVDYQNSVYQSINASNSSNYEPPLLNTKVQPPPLKQRKLNSNNPNMEYNKFMEQLISPMGGYINPFQIQQQAGEKYMFNGAGFTPVLSAFPQDAQTGGQNYPQNTFSNSMNNADINQWQYMNMLSLPIPPPPSSTVLQQSQQLPSSYQPYVNGNWGFMNYQQPSQQQLHYQQSSQTSSQAHQFSQNQNQNEKDSDA